MTSDEPNRLRTAALRAEAAAAKACLAHFEVARAARAVLNQPRNAAAREALEVALARHPIAAEPTEERKQS